MTGLLIIQGKKSQILRDFWGQNGGKIGRFRGNFAAIFRANLAGKQSVKKQRILWLFSGKFRKKSIGFALIRPAFLMFSNRGHHLLFQQQYALEMNTLRSRNEPRETSEALI